MLGRNVNYDSLPSARAIHTHTVNDVVLLSFVGSYTGPLGGKVTSPLYMKPKDIYTKYISHNYNTLRFISSIHHSCCIGIPFVQIATVPSAKTVDFPLLHSLANISVMQ